MGDNIHNTYRNIDPAYYNQTGQEWPGYGQPAQQDPNYRPDPMYMGQQERYMYPPYDANYVNYQNVPPNDPQMNMGYQYHPSDPGNMGYPPYARDAPMMNYYNQPRNVMVPNYVKKEAMDMGQNMGSANVNSPNVGYYPNLMYYNGQQGMKNDPKEKRNEGQPENDFFVNNTLSQPSLSFREVATAMLSMASGKKMSQPRSRSSSKSRTANKAAKTSAETPEQTFNPPQPEPVMTTKPPEPPQPPKKPETTQPKTTEQSPSGSTRIGVSRRRASQCPDIDNFNDPNFTYIPVSKLSHIDLNKYRNRGLQQLSMYNQYLQQGHLGQSSPQTSQATGGNTANKTKKTVQNNLNQNNQEDTISHNVSMAVMRNVKEWTPIKKINPNILTPSARFFPPTPKALSIIKNEHNTHKMNVVEEINVENDLIKNLKKNSISAASSLMESFQQSFSNKRKRIKNCLVEDCRHVIGEHPKIDIQYSSVEVNGEKKYFLNEILSTLLPYHLFYYENIYRTEVQRYDYSQVSNQVNQLRERLANLSKNEDYKVQQSVYPCVKESFVTCNDCLLESGQEATRMLNTI